MSAAALSGIALVRVRVRLKAKAKAKAKGKGKGVMVTNFKFDPGIDLCVRG